LIWILGFNGLVNEELILYRAKEPGTVGLGTLSLTFAIIAAITLIVTIWANSKAPTT